MMRFRPGKWTLLTMFLGIGAYVLLRLIRTELVDFEVYRTAAARALAAEPLFRLDDGHYQYKYLPAFALVMAPFAWLPAFIGGLFVTSFAIFDLMQRPLYMFVLNNGIPALGALGLIACLFRLRWRALA